MHNPAYGKSKIPKNADISQRKIASHTIRSHKFMLSFRPIGQERVKLPETLSNSDVKITKIKNI